MSIRDAAARANVTEKTVRRWIKSGRLHAVKLGGQYRITVADLETARLASPDTDVHDVQVTSTQRLDTGHDSPSVDMSHRPDSGQGRQHAEPLDLRPLVDHIAALESQVQQLTEVSTMWQFRAHHLENELKQLAAGEIVPRTTSEPPGSSRSDETGPRGVLDQLRRWLALGRVDRH
ncbi:MAG: helix-turn-helix domain-containing protein [Chloroflexota bacterium]|nr:helix-turn-helix domain-containing protein [Chloroflexota bacterium]